MSKKILAIVEGEKKEPQLLNRLFDTYKERRQIVSYGANLYDLYERIRSYYGDDLEDWDFLLFLREQEADEEKKKILAFYQGNIEKRELKQKMGIRLPAFMLPNGFYPVERMPLTKNGKIDRKELMKGRK